MIIFAFKKGELKEKTQDSNFSLPIKNPNPLLRTDSGLPNLVLWTEIYAEGMGHLGDVLALYVLEHVVLVLALVQTLDTVPLVVSLDQQALDQRVYV